MAQQFADPKLALRRPAWGTLFAHDGSSSGVCQIGRAFAQTRKRLAASVPMARDYGFISLL